MNEQTVIFTDGSSRGNPGPGGYAAIIVTGGKVIEFGGQEAHTTNNRMELRAAIEALKFLKGSTFLQIQGRTLVYTDSRYLINGITKWVFGWQKNGWITGAKEEVQNRDLWEALVALVRGKKIDWQYIGGHVGIAGNTRCDEIATTFADNKKIDLYSGFVESCPIKDILNINIDHTLVAEKSETKNRSRAKAYSYLSMINGTIKTHATWAECEARVKGVKGAKFKKALDAVEEKNITGEWRA